MIQEESIEIAAPASRIWAVWTDVERWPEWTRSMNSVSLLNKRPFAVGSKARIRQPGLPPATWRITRVEPERLFVWESASIGLKTVAVHSIESRGDDRCVAKMRLETKGLLSFLLQPFSAKAHQYLGMEARGLKARSEALEAAK